MRLNLATLEDIISLPPGESVRKFGEELLRDLGALSGALRHFCSFGEVPLKALSPYQVRKVHLFLILSSVLLVTKNNRF